MEAILNLIKIFFTHAWHVISRNLQLCFLSLLISMSIVFFWTLAVPFWVFNFSYFETSELFRPWYSAGYSGQVLAYYPSDRFGMLGSRSVIMSLMDEYFNHNFLGLVLPEDFDAQKVMFTYNHVILHNSDNVAVDELDFPFNSFNIFHEYNAYECHETTHLLSPHQHLLLTIGWIHRNDLLDQFYAAASHIDNFFEGYGSVEEDEEPTEGAPNNMITTLATPWFFFIYHNIYRVSPSLEQTKEGEIFYLYSYNTVIDCLIDEQLEHEMYYRLQPRLNLINFTNSKGFVSDIFFIFIVKPHYFFQYDYIEWKMQNEGDFFYILDFEDDEDSVPEYRNFFIEEDFDFDERDIDGFYTVAFNFIMEDEEQFIEETIPYCDIVNARDNFFDKVLFAHFDFHNLGIISNERRLSKVIFDSHVCFIIFKNNSLENLHESFFLEKEYNIYLNKNADLNLNYLQFYKNINNVFSISFFKLIRNYKKKSQRLYEKCISEFFETNLQIYKNYKSSNKVFFKDNILLNYKKENKSKKYIYSFNGYTKNFIEQFFFFLNKYYCFQFITNKTLKFFFSQSFYYFLIYVLNILKKINLEKLYFQNYNYFYKIKTCISSIPYKFNLNKKLNSILLKPKLKKESLKYNADYNKCHIKKKFFTFFINSNKDFYKSNDNFFFFSNFVIDYEAKSYNFADFKEDEVEEWLTKKQEEEDNYFLLSFEFKYEGYNIKSILKKAIKSNHYLSKSKAYKTYFDLSDSWNYQEDNRALCCFRILIPHLNRYFNETGEYEHTLHPLLPISVFKYNEALKYLPHPTDDRFFLEKILYLFVDFYDASLYSFDEILSETSVHQYFQPTNATNGYCGAQPEYGFEIGLYLNKIKPLKLNNTNKKLTISFIKFMTQFRLFQKKGSKWIFALEWMKAELDQHDHLNAYQTCPWFFKRRRYRQGRRTIFGFDFFLKNYPNELFAKSFDYPFIRIEYSLKNSTSYHNLFEKNELEDDALIKGEILDESIFTNQKIIFSNYYKINDYDFDKDEKRGKYKPYFFNNDILKVFKQFNLCNIRENFTYNIKTVSDEEILYFLLDKEINLFIDDFISDNLYTQYILAPLYDIGFNLILRDKKEFYRGCMIPVLKYQGLSDKQVRFWFNHRRREKKKARKRITKYNYLRQPFEPDLFSIFFCIQTTRFITKYYMQKETYKFGKCKLRNINFYTDSIRTKKHINRAKRVILYNVYYENSVLFEKKWFTKLIMFKFYEIFIYRHFDNLRAKNSYIFKLEKELLRITFFKKGLKLILYNPIVFLQKCKENINNFIIDYYSQISNFLYEDKVFRNKSLYLQTKLLKRGFRIFWTHSIFSSLRTKPVCAKILSLYDIYLQENYLPDDIFDGEDFFNADENQAVIELKAFIDPFASNLNVTDNGEWNFFLSSRNDFNFFYLNADSLFYSEHVFHSGFLYQVVQPVIDDAPAGTPHADRSFFSWRCMINMGDYVIEDELESQGEIDEYD